MNIGTITKMPDKYKTYSFDDISSRNGLYILTSQSSRPLRLFYKYYSIELMFALDIYSGWTLNNMGFSSLGDSYREGVYEDYNGELTMVFKGNK